MRKCTYRKECIRIVKTKNIKGLPHNVLSTIYRIPCVKENTNKLFQDFKYQIRDEVQVKFLELKLNSTPKEDFKDQKLKTSGVKSSSVYLLISSGSNSVCTCLCEATFSTLVDINTKYRDDLNIEEDSYCVLFSIQSYG
ncbi:uncharacterized protein LOC143025937 [Oratosquilla oratoria]|uniref:uncharacterized protein LOC143025937 n=1 Tax=Oratosquilla oratoria TaxID=337810 RepID=UPI003F7652AF